MKHRKRATRFVSVLAVWSLAASAMAANVPRMSNVCNSAAAPGGAVLVDADCSGTELGSKPATSAEVFFSTDGQVTWSRAGMPRVGMAGFDSTFRAELQAPANGTVHYYVRAHNGSNYGVQSPHNSANAWPPGDNLVVEYADEPTGDAVEPEGPWMDLTGAWVGYSDDMFYAVLANSDGTWPERRGILGPWYAYAVGFVNGMTPSDTWVFTMSNTRIPLVVSPGLFIINRFDPAQYTRIGDIEVTEHEGRLHMRCLKSDVVEHPVFGPWPNDSGYMAVAGRTEAVYGIGDNRMRDSTSIAFFHPEYTPRFTVGQNREPGLSRAKVTPRSGLPADTFTFTARYEDADSNTPVVHAVVVDADTNVLVPEHHRYSEGVSYAVSRAGFTPGWHRFCFVFNDGLATAMSVQDSFLVTGAGMESPVGNAVVPDPAATLLAGRGGVLVCLGPGVLLDVAGREVADLRSGENDVRHVVPGVYFVSVSRNPGYSPASGTVPGFAVVQKVVIQR